MSNNEFWSLVVGKIASDIKILVFFVSFTCRALRGVFACSSLSHYNRKVVYVRFLRLLYM